MGLSTLKLYLSIPSAFPSTVLCFASPVRAALSESMASDSSPADQRVDEHFEEKKVTNDTKLEEEEVNLQPKNGAGRDEVDNARGENLAVTATDDHASEHEHELDVTSVIDAKKEDVLAKIGEIENPVLESEPSHSSAPTSEINEGETKSKADSDDETRNKVQQNIEDVEVPSTSLNIPQEVSIGSTGTEILQDDKVKVEVEAQEKVIPVYTKDSEDEVQEPVQDVSEAPEKVDDVEVEEVDRHPTVPTTIEVPVKDLEVVSGSPEEEKPEKAIESQEPIPDLTVVDDGAEVVIDSSLHEGKASVDAEVVGKEEEIMEKETTETSAETTETPIDSSLLEGRASGATEVAEKEKENLEEETTETAAETQVQEGRKSKAESTQAMFAEDKLSQGVVVEENGEQGENVLEPSTIMDSSIVAELSTEHGNASEVGGIIEEKKEDTIGSYSIDTTLSGGGASSEGDIVVPKLTDDNTEALKTVLGATSTELTAVGVSSEEVNAPETFETVEEKDKSTNIEVEKKDLEVISKDPNFVTETSNAIHVGHQSLGDEKTSLNLEGQDAATVESPESQTTVNEPSEQVIEKNESINSENVAPTKPSRGLSLAEAFAEEVKDIEETETIVEKNETSRELDVGEKTSVAEVTDIGPSEVAEEKKDETLEEKSSTEEIKDVEALGKVIEEVVETSRELTMEENNATIPEDKKEEVKIGESVETATGKQEHEELSSRKEVSEKASNQDPVIPSGGADSKLVKEVTKRESSNIFSKVKRSIVKAKKAILGKSTSSKTLSSERTVYIFVNYF
ncbi:hypothetical protein HPP92_016669 [Vanilla planifolia]|uniref:Uncharacterized protein n=1 Tax=Vanilla planifolia TaxID=51239 RepID=A0A835QIJ3_VANPL|nr:hypothetical protein HPP92_016669 [Vanilla planifolia]